MKAEALQIHWHEKQPIFSVDFEPIYSETDTHRFATGGADQAIRVWMLNQDKSVQFLCTMKKHTKAVNTVRFRHSGGILASASDDGMVFLWKQGEMKKDEQLNEEGEGCVENWQVTASYRCSSMENVFDMCWSPRDDYILVGLTDHHCQIWDVESGKLIKVISDHSHFVQGVAWDPLNQLVASQSSDRCVRVYSLSFKKGALTANCVQKSSKLSAESDEKKGNRMFHDDTLVSLFRRCTFSPDGSLFLAPTGIVKNENNEIIDTAFVFARNQKTPIAYLYGFTKATVAIRFSPVIYKLRENQASIFSLDYRMVFAVLSHHRVSIFDTQQISPLAVVENLHYSHLTDLAWTIDGSTLLVTSNDGFTSRIVVENDEFGVKYDPQPIFESLDIPIIYPKKVRKKKESTSNDMFENGLPTETDQKEELSDEDVKIDENVNENCINEENIKANQVETKKNVMKEVATREIEMKVDTKDIEMKDIDKDIIQTSIDSKEIEQENVLTKIEVVKKPKKRIQPTLITPLNEINN